MLLNIQALRAIAAYLVVVVHLAGFAQSKGCVLLGVGHSGVDLFFVISGFIMVYTTSSKDVTPTGFAFHRISRVVPLYWIVTFGVFFIALVAPTLLQATRASLEELLKSLMFFPFQKTNGLIQPVVFVGWTLNYEMFFYLLFTLGLFSKCRAVGLAAIIACLGISVIGGIALHPTGTVAKFYTNSILMEFAFGIIIGIFYQDIATAKGVFICSVAAILISIASVVLGRIFWPHLPRVLAYGVPSAFIVAAAVNLEGNGFILHNPTVQFLGAASYAIYLTHFFVIQVVIKSARVFHANSTGAIFVLALASVLMVTLLGALTHALIERPLTKLAKTMYRGQDKGRHSKDGFSPPHPSTVL